MYYFLAESSPDFVRLCVCTPCFSLQEYQEAEDEVDTVVTTGPNGEVRVSRSRGSYSNGVLFMR